MLTSEIKRKIDSARNILVGNVTNPISQVDQITNALIYKFMDDMDQENLDVDLKPQFFVGDYAKYSWTKLLDKKLSGQERFNLYEEGIKKLTYANHIPELFRNIFKNARVPYNDPRVLTLFLKEIDGFSYSHSEELGNAFEYLLSILGSQGDAGQFRTPRHIIDFITEVVGPKKNETILDPACGTAGFLISAYKHILKAHDGLDNKTGKPTNKEKDLTPDEKTKLMNNIVGYDVSPDMVKLSLVNMYLHGFQSPHIHKYNTLTDEKRWDEQFDVIMANPPFMTPKGGVETHKRFSIQANRSEVLFVDYIMEHLSINGRAGIIVPEGIIFKGDKAYKALRKKLVEDGLFAVVSLPAGVFRPYSGVKTSILLFDNQVSKQTDEMLFVKIENDGYDLGAQRRKIDKNDLPKALELIQKYKESLNNKDVYLTGQDSQENNILLVSKNEIVESGDYNLTIDKYRKDPLEYLQNIINIKDIEKSIQPAIDSVNNFVKSSAFLQLQENFKKMTEQYQNLLENSQIKQVVALQKKFAEELKKRQKWEMVELGEVCEIYQPKTITSKEIKQTGKYKVFGANGIIGYFDNYNHKDSEVAVTCRGATCGNVNFTEPKSWITGNAMVVKPKDKNLDKTFLFYFLLNSNLQSTISGSAQPQITRQGLSPFKIPIPPLSVQKEIVEQIEVKQNAINHAREVIKNLERERRYFGQELRKLKDVEWVKLGDLTEIARGGSPRPINKFITNYENGINWIKIGDVAEGEKYITRTKQKIKPEGLTKTRQVKSGDFILSNSMSFGRPYILKIDGAIHDGWLLIRIKDSKRLSDNFLYQILGDDLIQGQYKKLATGGVVKNLNSELVRSVKIPLPSLKIQKQLVAEAEKEEEIIKANKNLIEIMKKKIEKVISNI